MVFTWTLNTEGEIRRAMEMGVDGFASDDPCFARGVVQGRRAKNADSYGLAEKLKANLIR